MAQTVLPFALQHQNHCDHGSGCTLQNILPPPLREACDQAEFLAEYLHHVPLGEIGIPAYYPQLTRKMQSLEKRNLIYPINSGLYVHVYPDAVAARDHYVSIEPTVLTNLDEIMPQIEERLMEWAEDIGQVEGEEEKKAILLKLIDQICTTQPPPVVSGRNAKTTPNKNKPEKIYVTAQQFEAIRYRILRDKVGLGPLQPLLLDPYIEDISCSGVGSIFVEHKIFKSLQTTISFEGMDHSMILWSG